MPPLKVDFGYSSAKYEYAHKFGKVPTAVSLAIDTGLEYGVDADVYEFEGERVYVGDAASNDESFTTSNYQFIHKYIPLILYHLRQKLGISDNEILEISTGLALVDWKNKDEFTQRLSTFTVNGNTVSNTIRLTPQGAGVYNDFVMNQNNGVNPDTASVIDIGQNTINFLYLEEGKPIRQKCTGYAGHGITSITKVFAKWLENTYGMPFYEAEAMKIFLKGKFMYNGEYQQKVSDQIELLKKNFVKKLMNSILVSEKKLLSTSEKVIFGGGGNYYLQDVRFPPNVVMAGTYGDYEFSNVRGY